MTTKLIEEIQFLEEDPFPTLQGYEVEKMRIVMNVEDGQYLLEIGCPCCLGERVITGTVECQGGHGCDHDIEMECNTCDGMGVYELEERPYEESSEFFFDGYGYDEPVEIPLWLQQKLRSYRIYQDPNQLPLFPEPKESDDQVEKSNSPSDPSP